MTDQAIMNQDMSNRATKVLLIEDNAGDADLTRLRLVEANADVEVKCVERLSDGLACLAENHTSLVLLDLNLPDSRGAATYRSVLDKAPGHSGGDSFRSG